MWSEVYPVLRPSDPPYMRPTSLFKNNIYVRRIIDRGSRKFICHFTPRGPQGEKIDCIYVIRLFNRFKMIGDEMQAFNKVRCA